MSHFPNIVDDGQLVNAVPVRTVPSPETIGSSPNRRKVRIVTEASPSLKFRLEALAFETGLTVAEICRYALWCAVLDAEPNKKRFCQKVARERLKHVEAERMKP